MIAPNIIIPFDGNHADIPSGYTRETTLDSKYVKGTANATNPNTTGGATTHTHTGTASHTHSLTAHTHTGTSGSRSGGNLSSRASNGTSFSKYEHTHPYTTGAVSGGTTNSTTANYGSVSNDPPYYTVIFIKASGYTIIPNNAMVFSASTTRTDFDFHTASANRFLKGAGTGANAGGTGGSTTNVHDLSHTHTTNSHTHADANTSGSTQNQSTNIGTDDKHLQTHTHVATTGAGTQAISDYSESLTTTETVQPAYRTLNAFKNASGSGKMPAVGDIALWLGTLATIPVGWKLCDGTNDTPDMRGRYYKNPASASASTTGGSNTHTHASQSHTHGTGASHSHTVTFGSTTGTGAPSNDAGGSTQNVSQDTHSHNSSTSSSIATAYASANTSANSSSNEPEYRTVAFIQFEFSASGGAAFLFTLIDQTDTLPSFD